MRPRHDRTPHVNGADADDGDLDVVAGVGSRLREVRRARRMTLADLAARTGLSASTLSRLETGRMRPTLEQLLPLARVHGVPLDDLVGAPATGDPRVHLKPLRRRGITFVPLTRRPGGLQAFKAIYPAAVRAAWAAGKRSSAPEHLAGSQRHARRNGSAARQMWAAQLPALPAPTPRQLPPLAAVRNQLRRCMNDSADLGDLLATAALRLHVEPGPPLVLQHQPADPASTCDAALGIVADALSDGTWTRLNPDAPLSI